MNFAVDLDRLTEAIFVGEETGGKPNFIGETTRVKLPYSGLLVSISTLYWQTSSPHDFRRWISPELPAVLDSDEYFSGKDPALDLILRVIEKAK